MSKLCTSYNSLVKRGMGIESLESSGTNSETPGRDDSSKDGCPRELWKEIGKCFENQDVENKLLTIMIMMKESVVDYINPIPLNCDILSRGVNSFGLTVDQRSPTVELPSRWTVIHLALPTDGQLSPTVLTPKTSE